MADKTLYDILEVSETASPDTIRAAWDRLSAKWDPNGADNATNSDARTQYAAIKDAYLTLGNPKKRSAYDQKLNATTPVEETSSALPKIVLVLVAVLAVGGYYYNNKREHARIEAARAIAVAKAKEAEAQAKADVELAYIEQQRQRQEKISEERARRQREVDTARFNMEHRFDEGKARFDQERERMAKLRAEAKEKHEETRATIAARQQLLRDKAELCRLERERYGRHIPCQ